MNKRDIAQAILLGLFYVQSCAHTKQQPPPERLPRPGMNELPIPVEGPEKHRARLTQLMTASLQPATAAEIKLTAAARGGLQSMVGFAKLPSVGEPACSKAGCTIDVAYGSVEEMVKTDDLLVNDLNSPYHNWYGQGGLGSHGRTPPRREGNKIVATWYTLTPPTKDRITTFQQMKGFQ